MADTPDSAPDDPVIPDTPVPPTPTGAIVTTPTPSTNSYVQQRRQHDHQTTAPPDPTKPYRVVSYNLATYRERGLGSQAAANAQASHELHVITVQAKPAVINLQEAIGYTLPTLPGYRLIRDTSRPGRANLATYVRNDLPITDVQWTDLRDTWPRTEHPGTHPARSLLAFTAGNVRWVNLHQPPVGGHPKAENYHAIQHLFAVSSLPTVAAGDWNAAGSSPYSPSTLARTIDGEAASATEIDNGVVSHGRISKSVWRRRFLGLLLGSDHRHAFVFTYTP